MIWSLGYGGPEVQIAPANHSMQKHVKDPNEKEKKQKTRHFRIQRKIAKNATK